MSELRNNKDYTYDYYKNGAEEIINGYYDDSDYIEEIKGIIYKNIDNDGYYVEDINNRSYLSDEDDIGDTILEKIHYKGIDRWSFKEIEDVNLEMLLEEIRGFKAEFRREIDELHEKLDSVKNELKRYSN